MNTKVLYSELTPVEFRKRMTYAPIAYLPLGTLEWHGEHLPLGADGLQSQGFFIHLAQRVGGIVLPMLFLGPDPYHVNDGKMDYYGMDVVGFRNQPPHALVGSAYWVSSDLFGAMLEAILQQLARAGFKIVVAHGHGPSTYYFLEHIPAWSEKFGMQLFQCWSDEVESDLNLQNDHAAANETSLTWALRPDLIRMDNLPTDLHEWPKGIDGKDPRIYASREVGEQIIAANLAHMETVLREALQRENK